MWLINFAAFTFQRVEGSTGKREGLSVFCQSILAPPTQPPHAILKNKHLQKIRCFCCITFLSFMFPPAYWHSKFCNSKWALRKVNANLKTYWWNHLETSLHSFLEYLILVGQSLHKAVKYFWIMAVVLGNAV